MSYVPAHDTRDLAALLGGLLSAALALVWWVRRGDRNDAARTPETPAIASDPHDLPASGPGLSGC